MKKLFHILETTQFKRGWLEKDFFPLVDEMKETVKSKKIITDMAGKIMIDIFYASSLQTKFAAETAMKRLGGETITIEKTKLPLKEVIEGALTANPDVIALRYNQEGGAKKAAEISPVPIINFGEEYGDHPLQALTDSYTILKRRGKIDGATVAIAGELTRIGAARALIRLLENFSEVKVSLAYPSTIRFEKDIAELKKRGMLDKETADFKDIISEADIIYQVPLAPQRLANPYFGLNGASLNGFNVSPEMLSLAKKDAIIMDPLPSHREKPLPELDADPRSVYLEQAENSLYVCMAILKIILS